MKLFHEPGVARLLYDSARIQGVSGTRSALGVDRVLLFQWREFIVDVMVQGGRKSHGFLQGQIVVEAESVPVVDAPVVSMSTGATFHSDEHGQFAVDTPRANAEHVLKFQIPDGEMLCTIPAVKEAKRF